MNEHSETPDTGITEHKAAPAHDHHDAHAHHDGPSVKTYFVIFGALAGFTLISFIANTFANHHTITHFTSFIIIMSVAVVKALLVATYFMHLIVDWNKLFVIIIPALILGPLLMIVLLPDIVLAWKNVVLP